jgi:hypothetical protein
LSSGELSFFESPDLLSPLESDFFAPELEPEADLPPPAPALALLPESEDFPAAPDAFLLLPDSFASPVEASASVTASSDVLDLSSEQPTTLRQTNTNQLE